MVVTTIAENGSPEFSNFRRCLEYGSQILLTVINIAVIRAQNATNQNMILARNELFTFQYLPYWVAEADYSVRYPDSINEADAKPSARL
jgi:hypothetical protein